LELYGNRKANAQEYYYFDTEGTKMRCTRSLGSSQQNSVRGLE